MRWIVDHAEDRVLCFDLSFLALVEAIAPHVHTVKTFIAMTDRAHGSARMRFSVTLAPTASQRSRGS